MEAVHPVCLEPPKPSAATKPVLLVHRVDIRTNTRPRSARPAKTTPRPQKACIAAHATPASKTTTAHPTTPTAHNARPVSTAAHSKLQTATKGAPLARYCVMLIRDFRPCVCPTGIFSARDAKPTVIFLFGIWPNTVYATLGSNLTRMGVCNVTLERQKPPTQIIPSSVSPVSVAALTQTPEHLKCAPVAIHTVETLPTKNMSQPSVPLNPTHNALTAETASRVNTS